MHRGLVSAQFEWILQQLQCMRCMCRCVKVVGYWIAIDAAKIALTVAKFAADAIISGTSAIACTVAQGVLLAAQLALHVVRLSGAPVAH